MKRNLIKVLAVLFLVIVLFNNVCYADLIDPERPYVPSRPPIVIDDPIPDPPVIRIGFWQQLLGNIQYVVTGALVLLFVFGAIMTLANNEEKEIEAAKEKEEIKKEVKNRVTKKVKKEESKKEEKETKEKTQNTDNTEE